MISTILSTNLHKGGQSVTLNRLLDSVTKDKRKHKLKVIITSDVYAFQSHARIFRWDGSEWKSLAHIPYSLMKTPIGLVYKNDVKGEVFMEDVKELHRLAGLILE